MHILFSIFCNLFSLSANVPEFSCSGCDLGIIPKSTTLTVAAGTEITLSNLFRAYSVSVILASAQDLVEDHSLVFTNNIKNTRDYLLYEQCLHMRGSLVQHFNNFLKDHFIRVKTIYDSIGCIKRSSVT